MIGSKMEKCRTPFFIWFTGRTGSTFLCDLLNSHPQIFCAKEQFCEVKILDGVEFSESARTYSSQSGTFGRRLFADGTTIDDPSDEQTLDYLGSIFSQSRKACGFKLKFPMQSMVYPEVVTRLRETEGLKVIELLRENVLKQAISLRNVDRIKQMGVSKSSNAVQPIELEPLNVDVKMTIQHANYFLRSREAFHQFTGEFSEILPVSYEQILYSQGKTLKSILDFLGVDEAPELHSMFNKTTPDKIADAISNYDELKSGVQGTELEAFLD